MKSCFRNLFFPLMLVLPGLYFLANANAAKTLFKDPITTDNFQFATPPGTSQVNDTLFCDQTEFANVHWRSYMATIKRIYGATSDEYRATIPDTSVWAKANICMTKLAGDYLFHIEFDKYPLVGVSQAQAKAYSKWRSDRVFEKLLIQLHKITWDSFPTRESYFTIEGYFTGQLKTILPGEKVKYYPDYTLATLSERALILTKADSFNMAYCAKHKIIKQDYLKFRSDIAPCKGGYFDRTVEINTRFLEGGYPIYNLRGNVAEWTAEKNVCAGGGWIDKREEILRNDTSHLSNANAWTGFRNVCVWRKWGK